MKAAPHIVRFGSNHHTVVPQLSPEGTRLLSWRVAHDETELLNHR
ncbi:hypothetical protein [Streptomyces sp. NPDC007205]